MNAYIELYDRVESLYRKFLNDVRASGLATADRWVWYTRAWLALEHATASAQITALNEVTAAWNQRGSAKEDKEVSGDQTLRI